MTTVAFTESDYEEADRIGTSVHNGHYLGTRARVISIDRHPVIDSCVFEFRTNGGIATFATWWTDGAHGGAELFGDELSARRNFIDNLAYRLEDDEKEASR